MSATTASLAADWARMSAAYLPGRTELLATACRHVATMAGGRPTVLDLGSGPGSVLEALVAAVPGARAVGVEADPVLVELHRLRGAGDPARSGVGEVRRADLGHPVWRDTIADLTPVDAVFAVQVLHYFPHHRFGQLLAEIGAVLGPSGVLVHLDAVPAARWAGGVPPAERPGDPWGDWWRTATTVEPLTDAFLERSRMTGAPPSAEFYPDVTTLDAMLAEAGFRTVVVRRRLGDSVLTIVRG